MGVEEASRMKYGGRARPKNNRQSKVGRMIVIHRQSNRHHWKEIGHEETTERTNRRGEEQIVVTSWFIVVGCPWAKERDRDRERTVGETETGFGTTHGIKIKKSRPSMKKERWTSIIRG